MAKTYDKRKRPKAEDQQAHGPLARLKQIVTFKYIHSSAAIVWGQEYWGDNSDKWFFKASYRVAHDLSEVKYWLLYRLSKRHHYHRVYLNKKPGYSDISYRLKDAAWVLFFTYVEDELGPGTEDDSYRGWRVHFVGHEKYIDLYLEAKENHRKQKELCEEGNRIFQQRIDSGEDFLPTKPVMDDDGNIKYYELIREKDTDLSKRSSEIYDEERELEAEEQKLLVRLMEMREGLWT